MNDKFVVTPDSFTQEQWCEMYVTVVNEYQNLKNNYNNILKKVDKAIEYIGNGNIGIPRKTRDKFIAILKGEDKE